VPRPLSVNESLHRGAAATHLALMGAVIVVIGKPLVQVRLQFLDGPIDLAAKRDLMVSDNYLGR